LLEKIQQDPLSLTEDEQVAYQKAAARLNSIFQKAYDCNVRIFVDAEESWIQDVIDDLTYKAMKIYNQKQAIVYNTLQFYRRDMLDNLKLADKNARAEGYWLGVKLVRGAYFERERERALEGDYCDPIHETKANTDECFDAGLAFCLEHLSEISVCLGTHNEHSCLYCTALMQKQHIKPSDKRIWFAQLLGMSDNISYNLSNAGYNVAKYVPYGPVEAVMPYLFRRAEENKSIAGQSSREYLLVKREVGRRQAQSLKTT
jgi:proline dehydrogenase